MNLTELTMRDFFAASALTALILERDLDTEQEIAECAYTIADAMIVAGGKA